MENNLEIFIAGSKALEEQRTWVRNVASNLTSEYHRKGKKMNYTIYDYNNFDIFFDTNGQQENYNRYIAHQADLVIFILDNRIGDKTITEFEAAYKAYSIKRCPKICIFSKKYNKPDANVEAIRKRVTQLNQYYNEYETREQLEIMVDKLLRDCSDPIIDKAYRRKITKTLLGVITFAIIAILGIISYAFNTKSEDVAIQYVEESSEEVTTEEFTAKSIQSQKATETKISAAQKPAQTTQSTPIKTAAQSTTQGATTISEIEASEPEEEVVASQPQPSLQSRADSGDPASCYELAVKYQTGNGVAKDLDTAFRYMKIAANGGYSKAYRPLAEMYHKGLGTTKDRDIAAEWYQKAADNGDRKALQILNNL